MQNIYILIEVFLKCIPYLLKQEYPEQHLTFSWVITHINLVYSNTARASETVHINKAFAAAVGNTAGM